MVVVRSAVTSMRCLKSILFISCITPNRIKLPSPREEVTVPLCSVPHFSHPRGTGGSLLRFAWLAMFCFAIKILCLILLLWYELCTQNMTRKTDVSKHDFVHM